MMKMMKADVPYAYFCQFIREVPDADGCGWKHYRTVFWVKFRVPLLAARHGIHGPWLEWGRP